MASGGRNGLICESGREKIANGLVGNFITNSTGA